MVQVKDRAYYNYSHSHLCDIKRLFVICCSFKINTKEGGGGGGGGSPTVTLQF